MPSAWIICCLELTLSTLPSPPVIRGTLDSNYVYTAGSDGKSGVYSVQGGGRRSILRHDVLSDKMLTVLDHPGWHGTGSIAMLRWQLIDKRYYCVWRRMGSGPTDYPFSAALRAVPLSAIEMVTGIDKPPQSEFQKRQQDYSNSGDFCNRIGAQLDTYIEETIKNKNRIYFDIWSRGGKNWEVYVTQPHLANRLTRENFHPERTVPKEARGVQSSRTAGLQWEKVGEWEFDWTGPFYVAAIGEDRYFVTDTGRVYFAPRIDRKFAADVPWSSSDRPLIKPVKPEIKLKELWKGPPVDALIHDGDAKTWYAFTKDQYFEIADPIKPKPHNLVIQRAWTANRAVETAAKCGQVIRSAQAPPLTDRTWDDLASPDARVGNSAAWALVNEPVRAVALLKDRLKPVHLPPAQELADLIADLGSATFTKREAAQQRLRDLGHTVEPSVRAAATTNDPERKRRLDQLLAEWQRIDSRTPDELRAVRAVQVLERLNTPEARRLLEASAKGAEAAILTREARKVLESLHGR